MLIVNNLILPANTESQELQITRPIQRLVFEVQEQTSAGAATPLTNNLTVTVQVKARGAAFALVSQLSAWTMNRIYSFRARTAVLADALTNATNASQGRALYTVEVGAFNRSLFLSPDLMLTVTVRAGGIGSNRYQVSIYGEENREVTIVPIMYTAAQGTQITGGAGTFSTQEIDLQDATHIYLASLSATDPDFTDFDLISRLSADAVTKDLSAQQMISVLKQLEPNPLITDFTGTSVAARNFVVTPFFTSDAAYTLGQTFRGTVFDVTDYDLLRYTYPSAIGTYSIARRQKADVYQRPEVRALLPANLQPAR